MVGWITYDKQVQDNEAFFIDFARVNNTEHRVLILEDCDDMISSRSDGNKAMSRILNISDGLVSLPARKFVFSTNLPSLSNVDPALLRPGRCFGAIQFNKLSPSEADAAAASIGISKKHTSSVTLSTALNNSNNVEAMVRTIGFV